MAWRRNLQVSSVGTSAERLGVGADHDGGRAAGAKGAATEETRKGLRLRILPGTGCHRAGPPSKSGARAGGGRSDDFTQSNCGGTEAELATSATTCLHPQPPSRAYICVRNLPSSTSLRAASSLVPTLLLALSHVLVPTATAQFDWGGAAGRGEFQQQILRSAIVDVGEIPPGLEEVAIYLRSTNDVDVQLYDRETGTKIVAWPDGILNGPTYSTVTYNGITIVYSGYNGDGTGLGHEYILKWGKWGIYLTQVAPRCSMRCDGGLSAELG